MIRQERKLNKLQEKLAFHKGRRDRIVLIAEETEMLYHTERRWLIISSALIPKLEIKIANLEQKVGGLIMKELGVRI